MLILGFDTCTEMCTVALGDAAGTLSAVDVRAPRAHLAKLLPLTEQALSMCGRTQADVEAIAVGIGPGSLTGVRIGVTTARALAQGLGVPCVGVPTLDVVAHAFSGSRATVCIVLDASRGEVYPALYDCTPATPKRLSEYAVVSPQALCDELIARKEPLVVAGDGLVAYGEMLRERVGDDAMRVADPGLWYPQAARLVSLARFALETGTGDYRDVRPIYTRLSDAEEAEAGRR